MRILKTVAISTLISISVSATPVNPEGGKDIYLNATMEVIHKKRNAAYYCELVEKTDKGFHYKAYFMSGELKMDGWYADREMQVAQGKFTYYYRSGKVESEGECKEGMKVGVWNRYDRNGEAKPEKVYASLQIMKAIEEAKKIREMKD